MKNFLSTSLRCALAVVILISTLPCLGNAEILDPAANHPLLRRIADDLNRDGIDVVQNWRSKVPVHERPVVAPLANYQISLALREQGWIREFNKGVMGAITAIKSSAKLTDDGFAKKWSNTPKKQRVFISFAREDVAHAQTVKTALEAQGYVAFIYINEPGRSPSQAPLVLGKLLRTAGTHLVIDTATARRKSGVLAEALALARYRRPPVDNSGSIGTSKHQNSDKSGDGSAASLRKKKHVVEVYGAKKRCPRTRQAIKLFKDAGAVVKYYDVDASARASKVVDRNTKYLEGGNLLPFIRMDGEPIHATSPGIRKALTACKIPLP